MKYLFVSLTALLALSAIVPASAANRKQCWHQTDASRLTGFYDVCPDQKVQEIAAPARKQTFEVIADSPRDSGGEGNGGGGGGRGK